MMVWTVKLLISLVEKKKKVKKESLIPRVPISVVVECGGARYVDRERQRWAEQRDGTQNNLRDKPLGTQPG